ncbi:hypothetical protein KIW84_053927 [Lathyrus oleraceus]|uniref:Protein FAR1-RELATED SEQUENCE n=1 Tax=Pisum sativum TaxID=3888 RepID=A0A9D5AJG3_PEA|nr:hypothetical protein KIW84_053927 [Pisum sativum]
MEVYLIKMKNLCDKLKFAGNLVVKPSDQTTLMWVDLQAQLLTFESRIEKLNNLTNLTLNATTNIAKKFNHKGIMFNSNNNWRGSNFRGWKGGGGRGNDKQESHSAFLASQNYVQDYDWYFDSGASNHVTHQTEKFQDLTEHHSKNSLIVGNGDKLKIMATDKYKMESVDNNRINLDLSLNIEYSVEDVSSKNGSSEIIIDRNIIDEVEEIGISEKENILISSQNIEINGFLQESSEGDTFKESNIVPFVGQIFLSEEEAFIFYKRYVYQHGFSVRKGRFIKQNGIVSKRDFFCHREGRTSLKIIEPSKEQRNRESTRCECKAHLRISLQKTHDMFPSGLSVRQLMRVIELEKNVDHGYLPFIEKDVRNLFLKAKKKVEITDVVDLLKYCEDAKKSCSKFQYAYTLDEERRLEHIFWSHAYRFDWYQEYGDVVVFDATYKVNSYEMPFGIFVGNF